jgi:hypothetical protein
MSLIEEGLQWLLVETLLGLFVPLVLISASTLAECCTP